MKIIERGHIYQLEQLDRKPDDPDMILRFVNREKGTKHGGTQTQEAVRALIDRTQHCDRCLRWDGNDLIIYHLRMALVLHECRAMIRKVEKGQLKPELVTTEWIDGHFRLDYAGYDPLSALVSPSVTENREIYTMAQVPDEEKPVRGNYPGE